MCMWIYVCQEKAGEVFFAKLTSDENNEERDWEGRKDLCKKHKENETILKGMSGCSWVPLTLVLVKRNTQLQRSTLTQVTHNSLKLPFREIQCPLLASTDPGHICGSLTYIQAKHQYI